MNAPMVTLRDDAIIVAKAVCGDRVFVLPEVPRMQNYGVFPDTRIARLRIRVDRIQVSIFACPAAEYPHGRANGLALFRCRIDVMPLHGTRYLVKN